MARVVPVAARWPAAVATTAAVLVFAVVTLAASWSRLSGVWWMDVPLRVWGIVGLVPGLLVWLRAPSPRLGQLLVAVAGSYYLHFLRGVDHVGVFAVGYCLAYLWTAVLGHLVLTWPSGRISDRAGRVLVPTCYAAAVGSQIVRYVADTPAPPYRIGVAEPDTAASTAASVLFAVLALVLIVVLARRWITATSVRRRPGEPVWAAIVVIGALAIAVSMTSVFSTSLWTEPMFLVVALAISLLLIPAVHHVQRLRQRYARWTLAKVLLDADRAGNGERQRADLQRALRRAIGDPGLRLCYRLDDGSYVDVAGNRAPAPRRRPGRGITPVRRRDRLFAVIEHDEAFSDERSLAEAAGLVAGIAMENAHLYTTLQAHIEQIRASRLRLATAAFTERRRIQRDLHDGAQQRLFAVLVLLDTTQHHLASAPEGTDPARQTLSRAQQQLREAIHALRELTEGIYPVVLVEHGLRHAVEHLADLSPIPIEVDVEDRRWPAQIEITTYFVVAEALANTFKHAHASTATVVVHTANRQLTVTVTDDGVGCPTLETGNGLKGLRDRVAAVGGFLTADRRDPTGTRIVATLPLEDI